MSSEDLQIIHSVLEGFLSPNKETRNQSQAKFNELSANLQAFVLCLTKIALESTNKQIKTFAIIAIRKLLDFGTDKKKDSKWKSFDESYKNHIKTNLYNNLISNNDPSLNSKICDTISMVAANIYDSHENWNELTQYIFEVLGQSSNLEQINTTPYVFENSVFILRHLFELISSEVLKSCQTVISAFSNFFSTNNLSLKSKTVEAISDIVNHCSGKEKIQFKVFTLKMLETTLKCAEDPKQEQNLLVCLTSLSDISVNYPLMLKKHFSDMFILMGKIVEKTDFLDENVRELCLEIIVTLIDHYPGLISKSEEKCKILIELIFKYANEMEDEVTEEWLNPKIDNLMNDEIIEEKKLEASINFISRLTTSLKSTDKFMAYVADVIMLLIQNESHWKYKYIGYMTVSRISENVEDINDLTAIIKKIFVDLENPHPKIKIACLFCIEAFSEDFNPIFQKYYHTSVVPICLNLLKDQTLRIKLDTLLALELFFSDIDEKICLTYCENVLNEVFTIVLHPEVQVSLINSVVALVVKFVMTCEKEFLPYSSKSMEIFIEFLSKLYKSKSLNKLYGPLLEVITTIGSFCEEPFIKFLPNVVDLLIELQNNVNDFNDEILVFLQKAWRNIIFIVENHFPEKINGIIESSILLLGKEPKVKVSESQGMEYDLNELFSSEENIKIKKKKIDLNTAETNDLSDSLDLISVFVQGFHEKFYPFIDITEAKILPLLHFEINSEVRISAAYLLKDLLKNVSKIGNNTELLHQKAKTYITEVFTCLETEHELEVIDTFLNILKKLFKTTKLFLSVNEINSFFSKLLDIFNSVEASRVELIGKRDQTENDFNEEVISKKTGKDTYKPFNEDAEFEENGIELEEDLNKIEDDIKKVETILTSFSGIFSTIFEFHKELCLEVVNKLIKEYLPKYLDENSSVFDKKMGIFILDDMAEFLGQTILPNIWDEIIKILIKFSDSPLCVLRQAAVYGIGGFAQFTVSNYGKYRDESIKALSIAIDMVCPEEESDKSLEWNHARDNAISSLGRIIKYQGNHIDLNFWVPKWLSYLPLQYDVKEAILQHNLLCDILLNRSELIVGENNCNLPKIIRTLGKVYESKFSDSSIDEMIKNIFTNIKAKPELHQFVKEAIETAKKGVKTKLENFFDN